MLAHPIAPCCWSEHVQWLQCICLFSAQPVCHSTRQALAESIWPSDKQAKGSVATISMGALSMFTHTEGSSDMGVLCSLGVLDSGDAEHPQKNIVGANSTSAPTESALLLATIAEMFIYYSVASQY